MTASRLLVGFIAVTGVGSLAIDVRPSDVQVNFGATALGQEAPFCASEPTAADPGPARLSTNAVSQRTDEPNVDTCPSDMVEVQGEHCQVVEQICEEYISEKKDRCAKYRNRVRCLGRPTSVHVCVDRYEYPNQMGQKPTVAVSYSEAAQLCAAEGKRLCTANEWEQACEGPEHLPYPYGYARSSDACNHDKPYIIPNDQAYADLSTRAAEIARVDQSEPSGSRPDCKSSYGVFDMTGNVDEWVYNEAGSVNGPEYESGLKGGYWGPVRNRCRPMTTDHNHWHSGYQIGFRCCADPGQNQKTFQATEGAPREREGSVDSSQEVSRS